MASFCYRILEQKLWVVIYRSGIVHSNVIVFSGKLLSLEMNTAVYWKGFSFALVTFLLAIKHILSPFLILPSITRKYTMTPLYAS